VATATANFSDRAYLFKDEDIADSGVGDQILQDTPGPGTATLNDAGASFDPLVVGKRILFSNTTNPANADVFPITARNSGTQIEYTAAAVSETSAFNWTILESNQAWATLGEGEINRLVFVVAEAGYSIEVVRPTTGHPNALAVAFVPSAGQHIQVSLATLASGALNDAANTATAVAAAIDALAGVASFANGTGATSLTKAESPKAFFGSGTLVSPTPRVSPGAATAQATVGSRLAGGSPMGSGAGQSASADPYVPPSPQVWAETILVRNDHVTNPLEVSFDGINIHGEVLAGEERVYRDRMEGGIAVRGAGVPFRVEAW
jgi:hypothetical protein